MESYFQVANERAPPRTRKTLLIVISLLVIGAALIFFGGRFLESKLTFHPVRYASNDAWALPANAEDVWFKVDENTRLHGWFFHARATPPIAATVLYFHGNGGNLSYAGWIGERLAGNNLDVLIFDYRGYGRSEGRMTNERALLADANAANDICRAPAPARNLYRTE